MNAFQKILSNCLVLASVVAVTSCKEGLDYENVNTIVPDKVWSDPTLIKGFLDDIHGGLNPGWVFNGADSDEGAHSALSMSNYLRGILTVENSKVSLDYTYIDKINFFLSKIEDVSSDILSEEEKEKLIGQAKFWRAWTYWGMVKRVGGIPLILEVQDISDKDSLYKKRNKTSECISQIIQDLDDAIKSLPSKYDDEETDYGRITKLAAMAFKGRVLLWYASPLFNPDNNRERWEEAYNVNRETLNLLEKEGYGLFPDFKKLWYEERNKEVIMVNQFFYPGHPMGGFPAPLGDVSNQPLLSLLLSFPKKDGSYLNLDKNLLSVDPDYNQTFMKEFYLDRDDRFYATVYFGGIPYPRKELTASYTSDMTFWHAWRWDDKNQKYSTLIGDYGLSGDPGFTGFAQRKGLDTTLLVATGGNGQTDWIEIRYAEVLMNMGECANELGKKDEALQVLYDIRNRAGIEAGEDNNYGITANSIGDIRDSYIRERQAEFAFEGKRFDDLRRWKRFDILNNQGARHGIYLVLKDGCPLPDTKQTILDPEVRKNFRFDYIENLDGDPSYFFNLDLNHWFYPLDPGQISQSKNFLEQNKEWGGTFDPLL